LMSTTIWYEERRWSWRCRCNWRWRPLNCNGKIMAMLWQCY